MEESIVLGAVQGIFEWLPVSSEGMVTLVRVHVFGGTVSEAIRIALFLHVGTVCAAVVYFWKDVAALVRALFSWRHAPQEVRALLWFIVVAAIVTGAVGGVLLQGVFASGIGKGAGLLASALVGVLLIGTGIMQWRARKGGESGTRRVADLTWKDALVFGAVQGLAVLPGFSRSGLTVSMLLLRRVHEEAAFRASFLASIPVVIGGNIVLELVRRGAAQEAGWAAAGVGLLVSFAVGLATIHGLMYAARKIRFDIFVIGFGILLVALSFFN